MSSPEDIASIVQAELERLKPVMVQSEEPMLWPEIRKDIENYVLSSPRSHQKEIGPSEMGGVCLHCLAARLSGWKRYEGVHLFPFIGTAVHAQFEQYFKTLNKPGQTRFETEMKVTVAHLETLDGGYDITGHIDLYDHKTGSTVDWKINSGNVRKGFKAFGLKQEYFVQASLYGIGLQNSGLPVKRSCVYSIPRDRDTLDDAYAWEIPFDPKPGRWAIARTQQISDIISLITKEEGKDAAEQWVMSLPRAGADKCFSCKNRDWEQDDLTYGAGKKTISIDPVWKRMGESIPIEYRGDAQ